MTDQSNNIPQIYLVKQWVSSGIIIRALFIERHRA